VKLKIRIVRKRIAVMARESLTQMGGESCRTYSGGVPNPWRHPEEKGPYLPALQGDKFLERRRWGRNGPRPYRKFNLGF